MIEMEGHYLYIAFNPDSFAIIPRGVEDSSSTRIAYFYPNSTADYTFSGAAFYYYVVDDTIIDTVYKKIRGGIGVDPHQSNHIKTSQYYRW